MEKLKRRRFLERKSKRRTQVEDALRGFSSSIITSASLDICISAKMSWLVRTKWSIDSSGVPAKVPSAKHGPQHQKGNRTKPFDLEGGIHYKTVHQHRVRGSSAPFRGLNPAFWPVGWLGGPVFLPGLPPYRVPPMAKVGKVVYVCKLPPHYVERVWRRIPCGACSGKVLTFAMM